MNKNFFKKFLKLEIIDTASIEENENHRKRKMLYLLMLFGILFLVIMGVRLFTEMNYSYSALNFVVSAFIILVFFLVRSGSKLLLLSIGSVLLLQLFFMFLFHSGVSKHMAFVWYYLFPLISLFLLGPKLGIFFSLFMIITTITLNTLCVNFSFVSRIETGSMIRITLSYLGVLLFTYFFEKTRLTTQNKLKRAMDEVNELAIRDGLTGLYNRRYMDEVIKHIVPQCRRTGSTLGFIMADIDYFKNYNDTYGHQAGDNLLNSFSEMITILLRRKTDYVFRYGGEEFALLLPSTNYETMKNLANLINEKTQSLKIPHSTSPFKYVTVSMGAISLNPDNNLNIEEIVGLADKALYEGKNSGRNKVIVKIITDYI